MTPTEKACALAGEILRYMPDMEPGKVLGGVMIIYPSANQDAVKETILGIIGETFNTMRQLKDSI